MMVYHDTGRDTEIVEKQHILYVESLLPKTRRLIELKLTLGNGSWEALEKILSPDRHEEVAQLRSYEAVRGVDLGYYLKIYRKSHNSPSSPTTDTTS